MNAREQRGLEIAATKKLRQKGALWLVPSQAGSGTYVVDPTEPMGAWTCSCPDFETHGSRCKHVYAVEFTMRRETVAPDGSVVAEQLRLTYRQEWPAYNRAQVQEKERVATLLHDLCSAIQPRSKARSPASPARGRDFLRNDEGLRRRLRPKDDDGRARLRRERLY